MADGEETVTAEAVTAIGEIGKAAWDAQANPQGRPYNPFVAHDFLSALEDSGSVRPETGWAPRHLVLRRKDDIAGVMPCYLKGHSQGEYIFDHAFADAYMRAGGRYYPKLLSAIPFTPATGPRLLAAQGDDRALLAQIGPQVASELRLSSFNINFPPPEETEALREAGYLIRTGQQYHFEDEGFGDWDGFLSALSSRHRKALRKERAAIRDMDVTVRWVTGPEVTEAELDTFWTFYQDTGSRKWGTPYLTRDFFSLLAERMADRMLLILADRGGRTIAGALNMIGGDTLYGRYWGRTEHVPFLHFELCYYQAIDFALEHGLTRVEAGAQGEHKVARGYRPVATSSAHWFADPGFKEAVADYLERERAQVEDDIGYLGEFTPFRRG
ncbi:GNAT family N-acetyltransferase [Parvularcula oceani]|uniref:GNAT family N-acetyltransferase n=1 Tax=Parvularcula oceani TaxID=1247963 RepID=UPI0004E1E200|nr:GNAT family N-acetyltransferase [Parvularcula oceani]